MPDYAETFYVNIGYNLATFRQRLVPPYINFSD